MLGGLDEDTSSESLYSASDTATEAKSHADPDSHARAPEQSPCDTQPVQHIRRLNRNLHDKSDHAKKERRVLVLRILESWQVEVLILLMVFADLAVTGVEVGLDNEIFCVGGEVLEHPPPAHAAAGLAQVGKRPSPQPIFFPAWTLGRSQPGRSLLQVSSVDSTKHNFTKVVIADAVAGGSSKASRASPEVAHKDGKVIRDLIHNELWPSNEQDHEPEPWRRTRQLPPPENASSIRVGGVSMPMYFHDKEPDEHSVVTSEHAEERNEDHDGGGHGKSMFASEHPQHHKIVCEGHHSPRVLQLEHIFHWIGITILLFFQAEILLKIWMEGWHFWHRPGHVLDCCVVTASLILELCLPWTLGYFHMVHTKEEGIIYADIHAGGLLTLRIFRIIRLAHGLVTIAHKQWMRMARMKSKLRDALEANAELRKTNEALSMETTPRDASGPELVGQETLHK